jgi:nitrous oxidase accessory protein NosD
MIVKRKEYAMKFPGNAGRTEVTGGLRRTVLRTAIAVSTVLATGATASASAAAASPRVVVAPGQSIQAAVDAATPGTTIDVEAGHYSQIVNVTKPEITLKGAGDGPDGTVLSFPGPGDPNCTYSVICVSADNVRVTGLRVQGAFGAGIVTGMSGLKVDHAAAIGNGLGVFVFQATKANVVLWHNQLAGNGVGVQVSDSRTVFMADNQVSGNCQGVVAVGIFDPASVMMRNNNVVSNNMLCPANPFSGARQGTGILLVGASDSAILGNHVAYNQGTFTGSGGITVTSVDASLGGRQPSNVVIEGNESLNNMPFDLAWDGTGQAVIFRNNDCQTSSPGFLCTGR